MNEKNIIEKYKDSIFAIGFSGGKDSTATLIYLTHVLKLKNVIPVFADTGHESDLTYNYLDYIESVFGKVERIHGTCGQIYKKENVRVPDREKKLDMRELCKIKGRFPSSQRRFCTTELKLKAQQKWIEEKQAEGVHVVNVSGVRRDESPRRANAPYWLDHDEFMNCPLWQPIVEWTWNDVFALHDEFGIKPNPLYKLGFARVGCFPCIMARKDELANIAIHFPEVFDELESMELDVKKKSKNGCSSFFPFDTTSKRYRRQYDEASNTHYSSAKDVMDWATNAPDPGQQELDLDFGEDVFAPSCSSLYGLCE